MSSVAGTAERLLCSRCQKPLNAPIGRDLGDLRCSSCDSRFKVVAFPSLFKDLQRSEGHEIQAENEAACYNHPHKKADIVCEDCGRFLCSLCDIQIGARHTCPACIDLAKENKSELTVNRTLHDSIALSLAILPALMWPITLVTAPAAIFYAIRHWKTPTSLIPRSKIRPLAAIIIGVIQLVLWATLFVGMLR
ncbi:MAG: B-box zinc finger protein [Desulfuromonadales bacterium]|nr:B-box zinc finger protein [Desulfuromonadales bacterium]